jgi:hypothetical protein
MYPSFIGDCYIAVTGVPDVRDDHAVLLAEFAHECRIKTNLVISELANEFGTSVNNLSMRFGLHSGEVTAGVLRGAKSRFELFGDTINTASRMESTGIPNQIQISDETAKLLIDGGYESWLFPRKDLVHAKGKGCLQTYWLEINGIDSNESPLYEPSDFERDDKTKRTISQPSFAHDMYSESMGIETDVSIVDDFQGDGINLKDATNVHDLSRHSSSSSIFVGGNDADIA